MSGYATINGASKELTAGFATIGGAWKTISKGWVTKYGVWKQIFRFLDLLYESIFRQKK